jgi:hypothetical protein
MLIEREPDQQRHRVFGDQAVRLVGVGEVAAGGQGSIVLGRRGFARGREGITVAASSTQVFSLREGKIVRLRLYQDKEAALRTVGLAK